MSGPKADNLPFPPVPEKKFGIISMDIPWHHETYGKQNDAIRTPQKHYPTIDLEMAEKIPIAEMADKDCWVFMWITGPLMVKGVHNRLFDAWGVRPSSLAFTWLKLWPKTDMEQYRKTPLLEQDCAMGLGLTTRQNQEFVILGKIGQPRVGRKDIRQVIISPRREHSRKPEEYYRRVEHFAFGDRIDLFPGADRPGWTSWGFPHREEDRPEQVQRVGRRARCNTCGQPAQVNHADVCQPCMEAAAL